MQEVELDTSVSAPLRCSPSEKLQQRRRQKKKILILGNSVDGHGISAARLPDKVRTCEVQVGDQVPLVHHKKSKARQFHNS